MPGALSSMFLKCPVDICLPSSKYDTPWPDMGGASTWHTDVFEMAAAYLFHLVKNHPFVDGNKRVGAVAALVFLLLNNHVFDAPEDDFAEMVLSVARGEIDKAEVAVFIRCWSKTL